VLSIFGIFYFWYFLFLAFLVFGLSKLCGDFKKIAKVIFYFSHGDSPVFFWAFSHAHPFRHCANLLTFLMFLHFPVWEKTDYVSTCPIFGTYWAY